MFDVKRHHFATIGSTNTWAKEQAHTFSRDVLTLVTADGQTMGRGRFHRRWISTAGQNVYATFCHFVAESERLSIGHVPQVMALAAVVALREFSVKAQLKWPNDVIISGKKIAGILCETVMTPEEICVVTGIGLNVNMSLAEAELIDRPATSMLIETGTSFIVEDVLQVLQRHYAALLQQFCSHGFPPFLGDFRAMQAMRAGDPVRFHDNLRVWSGTFERINDDGSLSLQVDGESRTFIAGEFVLN